MKKENTGYTLEHASTDAVKFFKDGLYTGCGAIGTESALEAIFSIEKMSKEDWLICDNEVVYLVCRKEFEKGEYSD